MEEDPGRGSNVISMHPFTTRSDWMKEFSRVNRKILCRLSGQLDILRHYHVGNVGGRRPLLPITEVGMTPKSFEAYIDMPLHRAVEVMNKDLE